MALIVEDGTGLATAESYAAVSEADTYHANLGNTAWAPLATAQKEIYLRMGTNWLLQRYRPRWKGWRLKGSQRLDWPRLGVFITDAAAFATGGHLSSFAYMVDSASVPELVKNACCELALLAMSGPLTTPTLNQAKLQVKVGPMFVAYDPRSPQNPRYPVIAQILTPLLKEAGTMKLER